MTAALAGAAPRLIALLHDPVEGAWALWRGVHRCLQLEPWASRVRRRLLLTPSGLVPGQLADITKGQTKALLSPYVGSGNFTHRALREVAALSSCFADARAARRAALSPAAAATASAAPLPSPEAWQRCIAVGCGWPNCVVAAGLYALQARRSAARTPDEQLRTSPVTHASGGSCRDSCARGAPPSPRAAFSFSR